MIETKDGKLYSKYKFCDILRTRRKACGYKSCSKLAAALLPSADTFSERYYYDKSIETMRKKIERWEAGQAEPTISEFKQLCDVLECDPEYLWGECPTPRRETKQAMDITGLSENSIDFFIRQRQLIDKAKELANTDPEYAYYSQHSWEQASLHGLDILLSKYRFKEVLRNISELQDFAMQHIACSHEALKYRPDNYQDDTNDEWELNVPRSIWNMWKETDQQKQILELNITHAMTSILNDISNTHNI